MTLTLADVEKQITSEKRSTISAEDQASVCDLQYWNNPKSNTLRLAAAFVAFFCNGMKDSAIGIIIPHLETYYGISYVIVSLAFLAPFVGYTTAAVVNDKAHSLIGRRGVSILGPSLQLIFYVIAATAPPFPLFVLGYGISGLGSGMMEGSFNTFGGTLENSSPVLGLLHGCYGVGAVVLPAIGTEMLAKNISWNRIYLIHVCSVTCSLMLSAYAFRFDVSSNTELMLTMQMVPQTEAI